MDQTTQAAQADTPTAASAEAPTVESGNTTAPPPDLAADLQTAMAALAEVGTHPAVPAVLRDAWPALMRLADRRERQIAELAEVVHAQGAALNRLVDQITRGA